MHSDPFRAICNLTTNVLISDAANDRLTHVHLMFAWNPSHLDLQTCYSNICYSHQDLRHQAFRVDFRWKHLLICSITPYYMRTWYAATMWYRRHDVAPSIFGVLPFGRWIITHSSADFNFHDHRPGVSMEQHPLWCLMNVHPSTLSSS